METATIKVQGMSCQHCVQTLTQALTQAPGVSRAQVTLTPPEANVTFDPAAIALPQLLGVIKKTGFTPLGFTKQPPASDARL